MNTAAKKNLALSGALVLLLLGGGYRFHVLRSRSAPALVDTKGLCAKHGVPQAICFVCTPALVAQGGMCAEHQVPEALCTRCHAALIPAFQKTYDWCAEHQVPESQCVVCNPRLAVAVAPPKTGPMSPDERRHASPTVGCRKHAQKIQLASVELLQQTGITTTPVVRAPFRDLTTVNAELVHAADKRAELASRVHGTVASVEAKLGDWVEEGAVVARIDSPELGAARSELVSATTLLALWERNHARELGLVERGVGTQRAVIEADTRRTEVRAELGRATQRLRDLGLTAEQVAEAQAGGAGDSVLTVRAPFAGRVVARDAIRGQVVEAGRSLVTIVDTRTIWALLDIPEATLARIGREQTIVLRVHALRGESFPGTITWVASEVDRRTRTLKARAELKNDDGRLRANMFGSAEVTLGDRRDALLVPKDAVQWEGCCNVVFVPEGDAAFMPRKVQLGGASDTHVEVLTGLSEGEVVVSVGAFALKTELLKGSIGAGCCAGEE